MRANAPWRKQKYSDDPSRTHDGGCQDASSSDVSHLRPRFLSADAPEFVPTVEADDVHEDVSPLHAVTLQDWRQTHIADDALARCGLCTIACLRVLEERLSTPRDAQIGSLGRLTNARGIQCSRRECL